MNFRLLRPEDIEVRIGQMSKDGAPREWYSLLLYKDARCDMNVLDDTVGSFNWTRTHYVLKNVIYCSVGIRDKETGQFVFKDDCGTESNTDGEKGESSDSFKRACFNWGIGRELYTAPKIFIGESKDAGRKRIFRVENIEYDEANRRIISVTIIDLKDATFKKVFK